MLVVAAVVATAPASAADDLLGLVNARRGAPPLARSAELETNARECVARMREAGTVLPCADVVGSGPDAHTLVDAWWESSLHRAKLDDPSRNLGGAWFEETFGAVNLGYVAPVASSSPKPVAKKPAAKRPATGSTRGSETPGDARPAPAAIDTPSPEPSSVEATPSTPSPSLETSGPEVEVTLASTGGGDGLLPWALGLAGAIGLFAGALWIRRHTGPKGDEE